MAVIMGVDPGSSGGMALVDEAGRAVVAVSMPTRAQAMLLIIRDWQRGHVIDECWCEQSSPVWPRGEAGVSIKPGVKANFEFGRQFGRIQAILELEFDEPSYVRPAIWQKALGCLTRGNKTVSRDFARELFKDKTITHAVADALLIAHYGWRQSQ